MNTKLAVVARRSMGVRDDVDDADARLEMAFRGLGRCAIQDCRRIAFCGEYCYECADQIEHLRRWQAKRDAKRQAARRHPWYENLGGLAGLFLLSCCAAWFIFETLPFWVELFTAGRFTAAWGPR